MINQIEHAQDKKSELNIGQNRSSVMCIEIICGLMEVDFREREEKWMGYSWECFIDNVIIKLMHIRDILFLKKDNTLNKFIMNIHQFYDYLS